MPSFTVYRDWERDEKLNINNVTVQAVIKTRRRRFKVKYEYTHIMHIFMGFPGGSVVKNLPAKQETQVRPLGWDYPLEEGMETHSSTLAWRIPWTEEPGRLQSTGSQGVGHDWNDLTHSTWNPLGTALLALLLLAACLSFPKFLIPSHPLPETPR